MHDAECFYDCTVFIRSFSVSCRLTSNFSEKAAQYPHKSVPWYICFTESLLRAFLEKVGLRSFAPSQFEILNSPYYGVFR